MVFTPRKYMTDDQRFAARRPDVLVYETEVLEEDLSIAGEVLAELLVSTDQGDADWIVKLVDVFPADHPQNPQAPEHVEMGNYHMMVRSEVMRGRFRNSFERPEAFEPNVPTKVHFALQDVMHTFKKGHKIQIQVQSSWFPLIDRNPQKYVPNIYKANEEDFVPAEHRVYLGGQEGSKILMDVLAKQP
jgi:putative CocE/NonD family hydrolase